jgi:uncharacterized membrane protein HdeD (DUF308 family)
VVALIWPFVPYRAIVALVVWGVLTGIFEIVAALRLPRGLAAHWLVATGGISSIFLSLLVLGLPGAGLDRMAFLLPATRSYSGLRFCWRLGGLLCERQEFPVVDRS